MKPGITGESVTTAESPSDYPEGGQTAWLVVAAAYIINSMSFGMVNSFGVYQSYYEQHYPDVSSAKISLVGSIQGCFIFVFGLPSTICMYYVGPQMMVLVGGLLCTLSYMFLSISNAVWQLFVIQGVMFGLGAGAMYIHSTGVVFQYFNKKKALAQGIITAGAAIGGVFWPIAIRRLFDTVGFGWANRIIGFINIPMTAFAAAFLRPRMKSPKRQVGDNLLRLNFSVLRDPQLILCCIIWFFWIFSLFPGLFYVDLFCQRLNISRTVQQYNVAIMNGTACVARVLPGFAGDKFGRININILFYFLSGILPLVLWTNARTTGSVLAFCITWGFASGAPVTLAPAIVGQLFKPEDVPSCLSFFFLCGGIGSMVGPSIGGLFIPKGDTKGVDGFNKLAIFVGTLSLTCAALLVVLRFRCTRKIWHRI